MPAYALVFLSKDGLGRRIRQTPDPRPGHLTVDGYYPDYASSTESFRDTGRMPYLPAEVAPVYTSR